MFLLLENGSSVFSGLMGLLFFLFYFAVDIVCFFISISWAALATVSLWMIFKKAGVPGWICIIPGFNLYKLFEISTGNGWRCFMTLIPVYGIVVNIMMCISLARRFGKGAGFGVGLYFLRPIFYAILAFSGAVYTPQDSNC